ncbi:hypothetical protein GW17_00053320, partial [Ensete ventricosum]
VFGKCPYLCSLFQGMDEDKGPQSRKLYVEVVFMLPDFYFFIYMFIPTFQLAELWPSGSMDNVGIKDAIQRSKERKRAIYGQHKVLISLFIYVTLRI